MKPKTRYANILVRPDYSPYLLIVSDSEYTSKVPIANTPLKSVKRAAMDVYGVKPGNILVSVVSEK